MEGRFRQREQTGRGKQKAKGADFPREGSGKREQTDGGNRGRRSRQREQTGKGSRLILTEGRLRQREKLKGRQAKGAG